MVLIVGEALGGGFGWKHDTSDSCEIAWKRMETKHVEVWMMIASAVFCQVLQVLSFHCCESGIGV